VKRRIHSPNKVIASGVVLGMVLTVFTAGEGGAATCYADPGGIGCGSCASWGTACTLQAALTAAVSGEEIWLKEGVYKPTTSDPDPRKATFTLKSGVDVYGGFKGSETSREQRDWRKNVTVLSGDIDNNDTADAHGVVALSTDINGNNSYHVLIGNGLAASTVLDGVTVTAGLANGAYPDQQGGGIRNSGGSPTFRNVIFSGNSASYGGGIFNDWSAPLFHNAVFSGNSASRGGGVYEESSTSAFHNVVFSGNSTSLQGGGVFNSYSDQTFVNVTFSGNSASCGGGLYNFRGMPLVLANVVMWGNAAVPGAGLWNDESTPLISYCDIQGCGSISACSSGTGNIETDPFFVDADGPDDTPGTRDDNLRVKRNSPVIDAGKNSSVPGSVTTDLDGKPRFIDIPAVADTGDGTAPIVDMGAYEAFGVSLSPVYLLLWP
jgi:hypothetical protein